MMRKTLFKYKRKENKQNHLNLQHKNPENFV